MNDRELLELAARAAGITGLDFDYAEREGHGMYFGPRLPMQSGMQAARHSYWRPLDDDGDALRLACTLGLTVECDFNDSDTCTVSQTRGDIHVDESAGMVGEVIGEPDFSATRRAIVRAAAAIGEAMQ